jgi:hypothetical protein
MFKNCKVSTKKSWLLWTIILSHVIPVVITAYKDNFIHSRHTNVKLTEVRYWLWFFTWWSAWASLISIIWVVHKLFFSQKKDSYKQQLIDLVVAETNIISGLVFCLGGFVLTMHQEGTIILPILGEIKMMNFWLFYNFFWHVLAPTLVIYYFWKYCQVDKLEKKSKRAFINSLINPAIYFLYVMLRPKVIGYYPNEKLKGPESYQHPADYPYPFFFWLVGELTGGLEKEGKMKNNKWFFWHSWSPWLQSLFWFLVIIVVTYLGFLLLFYFLIRFKTNKEVNKKKNWFWLKND